MPSKKKAAVIIDIDRVLCHVNVAWQPHEFNWVDFAKLDNTQRVTLHEGVELAKMMIHSGLFPVFLTARHVDMRAQTEEFLHSVGLGHGKLVLTSSGDGTEQATEDYQEYQAITKLAALKKLVKDYDFYYAIDDQQANCDVFRRFGIPVLKPIFTEDNT